MLELSEDFVGNLLKYISSEFSRDFTVEQFVHVDTGVWIVSVLLCLFPRTWSAFCLEITVKYSIYFYDWHFASTGCEINDNFGSFSHFLEKEGKSSLNLKQRPKPKTQAKLSVTYSRPKPVSQVQWAKQKCSIAQQLHSLLGTRHPASSAQPNSAVAQQPGSAQPQQPGGRE